jgi:hypothetical protein
MLGIVLAICPSASALNPSLDISQSGHTAWTTRDGFVGGAEAFAQTPDGYLWGWRHRRPVPDDNATWLRKRHADTTQSERQNKNSRTGARGR